MGAVAVFNYAKWIAMYPEFNNAGILVVSEAQAQGYFDVSTIYWRNDGTGPVTDPVIQLALLNMLTAHMAARYAASVGGAAASSLVGRIGNATEGSVSVGIDLNADPGSEQWFVQTKYGFDFWQATAAFRMMRYRPLNKVVANPYFYRGGGYR